MPVEPRGDVFPRCAVHALSSEMVKHLSLSPRSRAISVVAPRTLLAGGRACKPGCASVREHWEVEEVRVVAHTRSYLSVCESYRREIGVWSSNPTLTCLRGSPIGIPVRRIFRRVRAVTPPRMP